MTNITLTSSMRSNLLSLRSIATQMDKTQERLSTGMEVNSAIDNASNFYQSRSLTNRAADLESLLDSMGQGIQTINAALEGIEAGTSFLEQLSSVATQASQQASKTKSLAEYEAEGYGVVYDGMSASEISDLLAAKGKIVLAEDIKNLTASIEITTSGAIIEGNGHKITFNATEKKQAAILADGANRSVTITNLSIDVSGEKAYGIRAANGGSITIDNIMGINVDEDSLGAQRAVNGDADLFDGATNTKIIVDNNPDIGLGSTAKAANAANDYAISGITDAEASAELGAGTWYLPSIGEWMELRGYTAADVDGVSSNGVANYAGSDMETVNTTLSNMGSDAETMYNKYYWSSSEYSTYSSWRFNTNSGGRHYNGKDDNKYVRCFQLLENCFNPLDENRIEPEIGDIMYVDDGGNLSWGKYYTYSTDKQTKTAVGVVCDVNDDDGSVKIVSLKDLGEIPYNTTQTNVGGLEDIDGTSLATRVQSGGTLNVENKAFNIDGDNVSTTASYQAQFNSILKEYDTLIKDSSYQGINLLTGGKLDVTFNETRSNKFSVQGQNINSLGLNIKNADWKDITDINNSIKELQQAIETLRNYAAELGNNYSIIQTRQDFTSALIDVLETGSDKLVLADMNEESANYLALQTRQQLAINSLSLASQSAQSVLSLF